MPTSLTVNDISAYILVKGQELEVFHPEYDAETKTATGWVASEVGQEYVVGFRREKPAAKTALLGDIFIDGATRRCRGAVLKTHNTKSDSIGVRISKTEKRRFVFSGLATTGDRLDSASIITY